MERKLTAILCADVHGYSRLMGEDEEATLRTLTAHRILIDSQIEQHHGRFVNSAGDSVLAEFASVVNAVECAVEDPNCAQGIFALFGAPLAHEDHPQRALYATLRMHDEVHRYADRQRAEGRAPIQIRVGVNSGEVVVRPITTGADRIEYTPIGHTTNLASRMQTLANPGY